MLEHGEQQPEKLLIHFRRREKLLGNFGDEVQSHADRQIPMQSEMGVDHFAGVQVHQLPCLPLEIEHLSMREPLQSRAKSTFWTPCPFGDSTQFAAVPG